MAKIKRRSLDSAKRAPVRKRSYEAPSIKRRKKQVPKEYQTFQKAPKGKSSCLWFLFLIFIATAVGFWYWSQQSTDLVENSVEFSVTGPDKIVSGDQVSYVIKYRNIDKVPLQKMELNVRWPGGFYFDESSIDPNDENATTWFLDDLAPGREAKVEIKGQLVGQRDEDLEAIFILAYQPENFHSDFKEKSTINTKITDSKIELNIEAVNKTLVVTHQQMKVTVTNLTKESLENLYIDILYPDDFEIVQKADELIDADADVEASTETTELTSAFVPEGNYFKVDLEGEESKTMLINGVFTIDSKADQTLVVEVGNMVDEKFRRLSRVEKQISVVNPKFDIKFEVNGKDNNRTVNWNDELFYNLEISNQSGTDITDMQITALVDSEVLNWETLETVGSYQDDRIIWTKQEDSGLENWAINETKIFTWKLKIVEEPQPARMIENIIKINIEGLSGWEQITSPLLLTVGENLTFNNGIYWDLGGRRVGSGLLPPQVGEDTEYLVVWSMSEATGDFDTVSVSSTLPPEVNFIGELDVQEGSLEFDLDTRGLIWNINDFDNIILPITASFTIQLQPTEDSVGQAMTLLNPSTVLAQGLEEVLVRSKLLKTSDVYADTTDPIGIVQ
ncbi:hypothetical protein K8R42_04215 [bacterium]|nr:hypothetical protein [bacterium]